MNVKSHRAPFRLRRWSCQLGISVLTVAALALAGCSGHSEAPAQGSTEASVTATPIAYPIPTGCPSSEEFAQAYPGSIGQIDSIDPELLNPEIVLPLPAGGCAYAVGDPGTATSSSSMYRDIEVWYFNLGTSGRLTADDLVDWAADANGTPAINTSPIDGTTSVDNSGMSFDLPEDFSGWTKSGVGIADGDIRSWSWSDDSPIPEYTQGASGKIYFALDLDRVTAAVTATSSGIDASDHTTALANGLATTGSAAFDMTDGQGYSVHVEVQGKLQPFTPDVTDAPPGKFNASSSSIVTGTFTNTTAARKTDSTGIGVIALYPLGSVACSAYKGISVEGADWQDSSYCQVTMGFLTSTVLAPDESHQFGGDPIAQNFGAFDESGGALAELNNPASMYAYFGGQGPGLTGVAWQSDQGCQSQTQLMGGQWFIAMTGWPDILCG